MPSNLSFALNFLVLKYFPLQIKAIYFVLKERRKIRKLNLERKQTSLTVANVGTFLGFSLTFIVDKLVLHKMHCIAFVALSVQNK